METSIFFLTFRSKILDLKLKYLRNGRTLGGGHQNSAVPKIIDLNAGKTFKTTAFLKSPPPGPGPPPGSRLEYLRLEVP